MIYLNDNFEGGLLTFRDHELAFKPETGSFIVFDVGIKNVHAVTEVLSGQRYTMLGSYDYADSSYDKNFQEIKNLIKSDQDKQKEQWGQGQVMPSTIATSYVAVNK